MSRHADRQVILGVAAFCRDAAAALVVDGEIIAAAQEERFTRRKQQAGFPSRAVAYCLQQAGGDPDALTAVVFCEPSRLTGEGLRRAGLGLALRGGVRRWQTDRSTRTQMAEAPVLLQQAFGTAYRGPIEFVSHQRAHMAAAFYPSPFQQAAILILDADDGAPQTCWGVGQGRDITLQHRIPFPHSISVLYSAITEYLGFTAYRGEYKVMGLAPYGEPKYAQSILESLLSREEDGRLRLNTAFFRFGGTRGMTSRKFHRLFGGRPRHPDAELTQRHMDLAASVQTVAEECILRLVRTVHRHTGMETLCLAGGTALNCVANGRILREGPFREVWIQPAAGEAGTALGAALEQWHERNKAPRTPSMPDGQRGSLLGPEVSADEARACLESRGAEYRRFSSEEELHAAVAGLLAAGKIVGCVRGRMEFGPRALGNRSILGDPRNPAMQSRINRKVKFRESFRPFAPSCLEQRVADYFRLDRPSPYMLLVAPVREQRRVKLSPEQTALQGLQKLRVVRSDIPAVTHVDFSARVQTVNPETSPRFHGLLKAFEQTTGCGVLLNTSFNVRDEPIVRTAEEAYDCFLATGIDALLLGDCLCVKPDVTGA